MTSGGLGDWCLDGWGTDVWNGWGTDAWMAGRLMSGGRGD